MSNETTVGGQVFKAAVGIAGFWIIIKYLLLGGLVSIFGIIASPWLILIIVAFILLLIFGGRR